jgi:hypothetical protein
MEEKLRDALTKDHSGPSNFEVLHEDNIGYFQERLRNRRNKAGSRLREEFWKGCGFLKPPKDDEEKYQQWKQTVTEWKTEKGTICLRHRWY